MHEPATPGYGPAVPRAAAVYTFAQLTVSLVAGFALLWSSRGLDTRVNVLLAAFVLLSLVSLPALWDLRPWAWHLEIARLALAVGGAAALAIVGALSGALAAVVLVACVVSAAALAASLRPGTTLASGAVVR
jgi:hypothetical protein